MKWQTHIDKQQNRFALDVLDLWNIWQFDPLQALYRRLGCSTGMHSHYLALVNSHQCPRNDFPRENPGGTSERRGIHSSIIFFRKSCSITLGENYRPRAEAMAIKSGPARTEANVRFTCRTMDYTVETHLLHVGSEGLFAFAIEAQSKNKRLAGFFESNGWSNVLVQDPYGQGTYVQNDPMSSMINLVKRLANHLKNATNQSTADDLANRRIHIVLTLIEVKRMISDKLLVELIEAIEKINEVSQYMCYVHVNEEAQSQEGLGLGSKLFTMVADTGVAAFRASGVSRALQVTRRGKYAFEEASTPKAFRSAGFVVDSYDECIIPSS